MRPCKYILKLKGLLAVNAGDGKIFPFQDALYARFKIFGQEKLAHHHAFFLIFIAVDGGNAALC